MGKLAAGESVERVFESGIGLVIEAWIIAFGLLALNFGGGEPEEKEIFRADFLADFDIGEMCIRDR